MDVRSSWRIIIRLDNIDQRQFGGDDTWRHFVDAAEQRSNLRGLSRVPYVGLQSMGRCQQIRLQRRTLSPRAIEIHTSHSLRERIVANALAAALTEDSS
jgi:hypothetical protein